MPKGLDKKEFDSFQTELPDKKEVMGENAPSRSSVGEIVGIFKNNLKSSVIPGRGVDKRAFKRGLAQFKSLWKEVNSSKNNVNKERNLKALNDIKNEYLKCGVDSEALDKYLGSWRITSFFRFRSLFRRFETRVVEQEYVAPKEEKIPFREADVNFAARETLETEKDLKTLREKGVGSKSSEAYKFKESKVNFSEELIEDEKPDKEFLNNLDKELKEVKKHQNKNSKKQEVGTREHIDMDELDKIFDTKPGKSDVKLDWDFTKSTEENQKEKDAKKLDELMNDFLDK